MASTVETAHFYIGASIVLAFLLVAGYGGVGRLFRRRQLGRPFWGLIYYAETVLVLQVVLGVVLLVTGHRVPQWLHYVYGSIFPLLVVLAGRLYSLRREEYDYVPVAVGALVAFGLTLRAFMTGLGIG